jgi:hypothetical protein
MSEFVTHMFISFAMGDWKQIKRMARDTETAPDLVPEKTELRYIPIHSSARGIIDQPAKEPLLIS